MSMIGKVTGKDWSVAPDGATHIKQYENGWEWYWYKIVGEEAYFWNTDNDEWLGTHYNTFSATFISKEEDLGMTVKQVKSIEDLEVGMFVKTRGGSTILITQVVRGEIRSSYNVCQRNSGGVWTQHGYPLFISWSYTYVGEYTPVIHEVKLTPEQLKIKELEETITNASKQLQELKEIRS